MPIVEKRWYVLRSYPRKESVILEHLKLHRYEGYLPLVIKSFYRSNSLIKQSRPLISGYVFVKDTGITAEKLRFTPGSIGLLTHCGKPVTVSDSDIERMDLLCRYDPTPEIVSQLVRGQKIRITGGILIDLEGEITDFKGKTCVVLYCGIPGYSFIVDIAMEKIEIIN